MLRLQVKWIANHALLRHLGAILHKPLVGTLLHIDPRASAATLSLVEEQPQVRGLESQIN